MKKGHFLAVGIGVVIGVVFASQVRSIPVVGSKLPSI